MMPKLLADRAAASALLEPARLRARLLPWYRRNGRKLPWREAPDAYRVWVSEVMLQQTQVATAIPFYQTFIGRIPTLMNLANARLPRVLALWSGLGYYRRARHLHEAARLVARLHGGRVPDDPEVFGRLPGVGRYTTGAVLSIAFDRPLPVVDGNVARVLSRLYALPAAVRDPRGARELWRLAEQLVPMQGAGQWNQALMELGALVCTPRSPRCEVCPVRVGCMAFRTGRVAEFPPAPPRRLVTHVRRAVAVIERDGALLMGPRSGRLLAGLWEPPGVDLEGGAPARVRAGSHAAPPGGAAASRSPGSRRSTGSDARRAKRLLARVLAGHGVRARLAPMGLAVRHTITFRRIEVELWRGTLPPGACRAGRAATPLRFVDPRAPRVAVTGLARKIGRRLARERHP